MNTEIKCCVFVRGTHHDERRGEACVILGPQRLSLQLHIRYCSVQLHILAILGVQFIRE